MKGGGPHTVWGDSRGIALPKLVFMVLGAPLAWTFHFLVVYFVVGLFCGAQWQEREATADMLIYATTAVFTLVSVAAGVMAYRAWERVREEGRDLEDATLAARGRVRLLLLLGFAGAVVFTPFIVLEGIVPLFVPICSAVVDGGAP